MYPMEFIVDSFLEVQKQVFWREFKDKIGSYFHQVQIFANFVFKKVVVSTQEMGLQEIPMDTFFDIDFSSSTRRNKSFSSSNLWYIPQNVTKML